MIKQAQRLGFKLSVIVVATALLSGCSVISRLTESAKDKLPGQRIDVQLQPSLQSNQRSNQPVRIAQADPKAFWSQPAGNAEHKIKHGGKTYYFSNLQNKIKFKENIEKSIKKANANWSRREGSR